MTYTWVKPATAGIISKSPARVAQVILTSASDKKGYVSIYDGESTSDPKIMTIRAASGETKVILFQPYLVTHRGLYVNSFHDVEDLIIQLAIGHE